MVIAGAVEGPVDDAVLRRLFVECGHEPGPIHIKNGKSGVIDKLPGYNNAARFTPWLVLIDLDDATCAPEYVATELPAPAAQMLFRVAVRQVESWLLADASRLASFLRVSRARVPGDPDSLPHSKQALVDLSRHSANRTIREEMVPRPGSGRRTGAGYVSRLIEFVQSHWDPHEAAQHSDSLRRSLERLTALRDGDQDVGQE